MEEEESFYIPTELERLIGITKKSLKVKEGIEKMISGAKNLQEAVIDKEKTRHISNLVLYSTATNFTGIFVLFLNKLSINSPGY